MPNMTGLEATRLIRIQELEHGGKFAAKIVGLTGNALEVDVSDFMQAGCDEVLTNG